jgi:hypothetical protein
VGRAHEVAVNSLVNTKPGQKALERMLSGKLKTVVAPCGARVPIGRRARSKLKKMQPITSAMTLSMVNINGAIDNTFSSLSGDKKPPGTYFYDGNKPVVFYSVDAESGKIVTRELFDQETLKDADILRRVNNFIKNEMVAKQNAQVVQINDLELGDEQTASGAKALPQKS